MEYKDAASQMAAALLRLRRYMAHSTFLEAQNEDVLLHQAQEWDAFVALLDEIQAANLVAGVQQKFEENQQTLAGVVAFVKSRRIAPTSKLARTLAKSLLQRPKPDSFVALGPDDDAYLMSAENRIYETRLQEVAEERTIFDVAKFFANQRPNGAGSVAAGAAVDQAYLDLRTKLSDSLYFANEAYVTSGAVTQVVGGKQSVSRGVSSEREDNEAKANIAYGAHELMHSIIDNLADIYKETKRFYNHHPEEVEEDRAFGAAILKSSKYIHRLFNAIKHLYLIMDIVERYKDTLPSPRGPELEAKYPHEFFEIGLHYRRFLRVGFALEALKKFKLNWADEDSVQALRALLATRFSLQEEDGSAEDEIPSAEQIINLAKLSIQRGRSITVDSLAGFLIQHLFVSNLTYKPDGYSDPPFGNMNDVRKVLTELVVCSMTDYYAMFQNNDVQDRVIRDAMKAAGRPYPRLNEKEPEAIGTAAI
jgi:hypothetical protein